jgi:hypothetical protein
MLIPSAWPRYAQSSSLTSFFMVAIAAPVLQATECPLTPTAHTQMLGYPSTPFGYAPTETAYCTEPGLASVNTISETDAVGFTVFEVTNETMAPRFQNGSMVVGKPLEIGELPHFGDVLVVYQPGNSGVQMGRLIGQGSGLLHLAHDNGGRTITLPWEPTDPTRPVCRITHYFCQPVFHAFL